MLVSLLVSLYVAATAGPSEFSLLVTFQIITSVVTAITSVGYETVLGRNLLDWKKRDQKQKIIYYIWCSIIFRFVTFAIWIIPLIAYANYLSITLYDGGHWSILAMSLFSGLFYSINNSFSLILRANNDYVSSYAFVFCTAVLNKLLALPFFFFFGISGYISCIQLLVALSVIPGFYIIKYKGFRLTKIKIRWKSLQKLRWYFRHLNFGVIGYIKYGAAYGDRILISLIVGSEVLGVYGLIRQVHNSLKVALESFYDPIGQKIIGFKNDAVEKNIYMGKVVKLSWYVGLLAILGSIIVLPFTNDIIILVGLTGYKDIDIFVFLMVAALVLTVFSKPRIDFINYFCKPGLILRIDLFVFGVSVLSIIYLDKFFESGIYLARVFVEILVLIISVLVSKKLLFTPRKSNFL